MYGNKEDRQYQGQLYMQSFNGMYSSDRKGGRLLVLVVKLMKVLVQKGCVVESVQQIRNIILLQEQ